MAIRVNNIALNLDEDIDVLKKRVCKRINLQTKDIKGFKIVKESIDARKKDNIKLNYSVEITCDNEFRIASGINNSDVKFEEVRYEGEFAFGTKRLNHRPVIIGMGPAGLFAGLLMAKKGYKPIVIERGECVEERTKTVNRFWNTGELNLESNVQFGEGGAGAFSDGKLTTRIKDTRCDYVLEELVKAGAPEEILYVGMPHIGTDILKKVIAEIREKIKSLGGEIMFSSRMEDILVKDNALKAITVNGREIPCEILILAIGHSSRDTYEMLFKRGVFMDAKPFAIGVRIEHLQREIDEAQYGKFSEHPKLKAAPYRLAHTSERFMRSVYSFCMCPGGEVVAAASEERRLVTNGMSYHARDKENANSAMVVSVSPEDFEGNSPLRGMDFQRYYESAAYTLGGGGYTSPVQLVGDFLQDKTSVKLGKVIPSYKPGYEFKDLRETLPAYVIDTLKEGLNVFDRKIKGFAASDAVLTGVETRTSAPVRITRNENLQSISICGIFPAGEGAGYAGGIVSAAVDGLRVAEAIMKEWAPL